ncbi:YwdI family protein [Domibacillus epiphyticus]|uniref:Uncharacterized protein n=1 Tax=Domibacillus epiphyticus TaxID=1714355 RepID=A0A1V2A6I9_9BACI|nr:YwdI family protein [Domibacillus epiphyticus]OMP66547.1 hypothetical protein BTO28_10855 [Domibacillus epiphyticus]
MNVSHEKVLLKMEQEMNAARNAASSDFERHVYAIKSMCELLIGSEDYVSPPVQELSGMTQMPQSSIRQTERIVADDGSNGDSIFDF